MVAAVALVAAAIVAVLGFRTATPVPPGVPHHAALVTVTDTPIGPPVPSGFIGLSLEYTSIGHFTGADAAHINPVLTELVRQLAPGGRPVLRIGGDTSDWGWFPTRHLRRPRGIRFTLGARWLGLTRALAARTGARLILGLNLESASRPLIAEQIRRFSSLGRRQLAAFELGNEPEVWGAIGWYYPQPNHPVFARRRGYRFADYNREVGRYIALIPGGVTIAGLSTGGPKWWSRTAALLAAHPRIRLVTFHLYPLHECRTNPRGPLTGTIPHLMDPAASRGLGAKVAPYITAAHRHHAQVRIDELNSVSCGGQPGVSDRFAAALWSIDTLFTLASEGADGVNFHTFARAWYRPFWVSRSGGVWQGHVAPLMYGLDFFNRAAPPGSRLVRVGAPTPADLRVWATTGADHHVRVTLIDTSPTRALTVAIKLPHPRLRISVERLRAPSLGAATGVTFGGRFYPDPTLTGHLVGRSVRLKVAPLSRGRGIYVVKLPPASAALLTD
jgi:hypothetical protein